MADRREQWMSEVLGAYTRTGVWIVVKLKIVVAVVLKPTASMTLVRNVHVIVVNNEAILIFYIFLYSINYTCLA